MSDQVSDVFVQVDKLVATYPKLRDGLGRARQIAATDPEMALTRVRKVLELVIHEVYDNEFSENPGSRPLENLLQRLVKEDRLPKRVAAYANIVRELGNVGTHGLAEDVSESDVARAMSQILPVLEWYAAAHGGAAAESVPLQSSSGALEPASFRDAALKVDDPCPVPSGIAARTETTGTGSVGRRRWPALAATVIVAIILVAFLRRSWQPDSRLPSWAQSLPAAKALQVAYDDPPPSSSGHESAGVRVGVFGRQGGNADFLPVADGDALTSDHDYLILVHSAAAGHLYVFQMDGSGNVTVLFPQTDGSRWSAGTNPVAANSTVQVPPSERGHALFLDDVVGVEHVYVAFSSKPWPKLQSTLAAAEARRGPPETAQTLAGLSVPGPLMPELPRGVGGTRVVKQPPQPVDARLGNQLFKLNLAAPTIESDGSAVVVERWFLHER